VNPISAGRLLGTLPPVSCRGHGSQPVQVRRYGCARR
jgi:hypothetical protein